jgi:hypothetical protein
MVRNKKDAIPAYTLPVSPAPFSPFERDDIPPKRINFEFINCPFDLRLNVAGESLQLPFGFIGKFSVPIHV